jgi:hypothetical protein
MWAKIRGAGQGTKYHGIRITSSFISPPIFRIHYLMNVNGSESVWEIQFDYKHPKYMKCSCDQVGQF